MSKPIKTTVRRMNEWDEPQQPQLPAVQPKNFVAPAPRPQEAPAWLQPSPQELMPQPTVTQVVEVHTSHVDRAQGFAISAIPLAAAFGFVAFLISVLLFRNPLFSAPALLTLFIVFAVTWGLAYWYDKRTSPDGIAFFQQMTIRQLLRIEQDFRHDRIRHREGMPPRKGRR